MIIRRRSLVPLSLVFVMLLAPAMTLAQSATPVSSPGATPVAGGIGQVRVIGVQVLEEGLIVDGTLVGGLSGLDYDAANDVWYIISDDRSVEDSPRFYTATLDYSSESFEGVSIESSVTLLRENGERYPGWDEGGHVPDTESIRFEPEENLLWYTSEPDEQLGTSPFVAGMETDGTWVRELPLPEVFETDGSGTLGTRHNKGFEGLTLSADGKTLWLGLEGSLYQDGQLSTMEQGGIPRFTNVDRDGNVLASFIYELDALSDVPEGGDGSNGAAEILAIDETTFLVLERMSIVDAEGIYTNYIKIYEADIAGATDVSMMSSIECEDVTPMSKRLVLDLNVEGVEPIDNVEGISWGPVLENGNRSLVLVSDNNFNPDEQVTEFIAFEVIE